MAEETVNFGFTRVGEGEDLSKNGYAALDTDRVVLDDLLAAMINHTHDASPRLGDPAAGPNLSVSTSGGVLPANTTLYYRIAYLDQWGLETTGSSEVAVTTPLGLSTPTAPAASPENTGGVLTSGQYAYSIAAVDPQGGETTASPYVSVQATASGTSRIRVLLPPLPPSADHYRLYRAKPGQTAQYLLADNLTTTTFYDDGSVPEDQTITTPEVNTTGNTCSVTVNLPAALPSGAYSWRVYRAISPGLYDGYNLIHHVVEPTSQYAGDVRASWVDDGTELNLGIPRSSSATMGGGRTVQLSQVAGALPLSVLPRGSRSMNVRLNPVAAGVFYKTRYPLPVIPTAITAWFGTAPSGLGGATPSRIHLRLSDSSATPVVYELVCADDTGYYTTSFPLTVGGSFNAEEGPRQSNTPIVSDPTAMNGQAVELNANAEYSLVSLGILDPGTYTPTVRLIESDPAFARPANDLQLQVVVLDANNAIVSTLATTNLLNTSYNKTTYTTLTGRNFTIGAPTKVGLAVMKMQTAAATYWIDTFTYAAILPSLAAGDLTLTCSVDGVPASLGGNCAVTVWF